MNQIEAKLVTWRSQAQRLSALHEAQAKSFKLKKNIYLGLTISLGGLSSILNMFVNSKKNNIYDYVTDGLMLIMTGFVAFYNQQKYPEKMTSHYHYGSEYKKIARDIGSEIILSKSNENLYSNLGEYLKFIRGKLDSLTENEPDLPLSPSLDNSDLLISQTSSEDKV